VLKIKIVDRPCIKCPVDDKYHLIELCEGCDAYKGMHKVLAKGPKIPTAVKCAINSI